MSLHENNNYKVVVADDTYHVVNKHTGVVEAEIQELPNAYSAMVGLNNALENVLEQLAEQELEESLVVHH